MAEILSKLPINSLRSLAASLREGPLSRGIPQYPLQQLAGLYALELQTWLTELQKTGMTSHHIALLIDTIVQVRESSPEPMSLFDLVLSGPDVPGIPTSDTAAIIHTLIEEATTEVILVAYAIHNGQRLFERLATKMQTIPSLKVIFCLDIHRKHTDTSLPSEIVRRFVAEFREKHWPGSQLPAIFYDPRSLSEGREQRASLHAKCLIVDRQVALVTSANFTEAAHHRNIEAGVIVRYQPFVERLANYFEGLQQSGQLIPCGLKG